MELEQQLIREMIQYETGSPERIQHFLKVHSFAEQIGKGEHLEKDVQSTLEIASIVHDIGIKPAMEKYASGAGNLQELEGPPAAEEMLTKLGCPQDVISRVSYLVGHHHTYSHIDGIDYQILVEADFLVNLYENQAAEDTILNTYHKIFKTDTGRFLCRTMFGLKEE